MTLFLFLSLSRSLFSRHEKLWPRAMFLGNRHELLRGKKTIIFSFDYSDCKCLATWGSHIHTKVNFLLNTILIHVSLGSDNLNVSSGYLHSVFPWLMSVCIGCIWPCWKTFIMSINHTCQTAFFSPSHSFPLRFKLRFPDVHEAVFVSLTLDIIGNRIVCNFFQYEDML